MADIEAIDSLPGTHPARALALDLWWTALGHPSRVRIPAHIELSPALRAELTRRAGALLAGGMAADLERAEAILRAIPAKKFGDPSWLSRNGRAEEAAVEEFHHDLQMLVQFIRRRRRRSNQVLQARAAVLMAALDSRAARPSQPPS